MKSNLFLAIGGLALAAVFAATPAMAIVVFSENFDLPLPNDSLPQTGTYVAVNDPSPGWQVQGGSATNITLVAGVDTNGVGGTQSLYGNWDQTTGSSYTYNQYTVYGVPGPATVNGNVPVPANQVEVSLDMFVSGFEGAGQIELVYQQGGDREVLVTPTNNAYKHFAFTLDQTNNPAGFDSTVSFNFRVQHGLTGFGFDANNILRIDNVLVQTVPPPAPVPGDYSGNQKVDAADYTVWRDTVCSTGCTDLRANGDTTGASATAIDNLDFDFWKAHFNGPGSGGGGLGSAGVPEPTSIALALLAAVGIAIARRRRGRA